MTIDKNIPIPKEKFDFGKLEVNDSVFIPDHIERNRSRLRKWIFDHDPENEMKFVCRKWNQDNINGTRVWRVK